MNVFTIFAAAFIAVTTQAQTVPSPQSAPSRQAQEQAPRLPAVGPVVRNQGLTDEQREKLRSINEKAREEQQEVRKQLQATRSELERLVRAEEVDEAAIRKQADAIGKLEGDLAILRAKQSAMYRDAGLPQMRSSTPGIPSRQIKRSELPQPGASTTPPRFQQRLEQVVRRPSPTDAPARKAE